MNVLVLMAGKGERFIQSAEVDPRFAIPKPLIPVFDKTILEWTLESFPLNLCSSLTFAVRRDHVENFDINKFLYNRYGKDISIIEFDKITRGNLETALISTEKMSLNDPLFILDSDNAYKDNNLIEHLSVLTGKSPSAAVCYFRASELEPKWAFVNLNSEDLVCEIAEKDPDIIARGGLPLVGTFYFDSVRTFRDLANDIIEKGEMTGSEGKKEFYVSQAIRRMVEVQLPVLGHEVTDVIPLGTPEDVYKFEKREYEQTTHMY